MTIIKKMAVLLFAAVVIVIFFSLRLDGSDRHYFGVDDIVVVQLVDKARNESHWQPDWYATVDPEKISDERLQAGKAEIARLQATHKHHYNFAGHISLSSVVAVGLDQLGVKFDSTVLLRAIAVFWDSASLLLLAWLSYRLLGLRAAAITVLCYSILPLAVQSSHYARPDALLSFQALLTIILSYLLMQAVNRGQLIILSSSIGLLLAFATATKASSLLYGIFPLTVFSYLLCSKQQSLSRLLLAGISLLASMLLSLALYFAAVDISWQDFIDSVLSIQRYYQTPLPPDIRYDPSRWGHIVHLSHYLSGSLGWAWLAAAFIGSAVLWIYKRPLFLIVVLPVLLLTSYYLQQAVFFDRSLIVLMLTSCLLAGAAVDFLSRLSNRIANTLLLIALSLCVIWPAFHLSWTLQNHIGKSLSDKRHHYQQQLLTDLRNQYALNIWLKWVDRMNLHHSHLPTLNNPHPRLYIVEHFNDPQSDRYLAFLQREGFVQVGYYRGDFAALPTNSLHIAHEAAHFYYFIQPQAITAFKQSNPEALSR